MKKLILLSATTLFFQLVFSQSLMVAGLIKNQNDRPVPAALVTEFRSKTGSATYTDSLGLFKLNVAAYAKLLVSCSGYNDTLANVTDANNFFLVLSRSKNEKRNSNSTGNYEENPVLSKNLLQDAISTQSGVTNNYVYGGGVRNYTGSLFPVFTHKEETQGSRYLFADWAQGLVINADSSTFNNAAYVYNYDKMGGGLLMTQDKRAAIEVNRAQVKSFTIFTNKETPYIYENVPAIDNAHYVQVISASAKYKIFKLTKTKFIKSDYHTNGITSSGNPYDEYSDEHSYFILNIESNKMQKLNLNKKSLREIFSSETEKLNIFLAAHSNDKIDDLFLKRLGDFTGN